jgi:hypothetical protein
MRRRPGRKRGRPESLESHGAPRRSRCASASPTGCGQIPRITLLYEIGKAGNVDIHTNIILLSNEVVREVLSKYPGGAVSSASRMRVRARNGPNPALCRGAGARVHQPLSYRHDIRTHHH